MKRHGQKCIHFPKRGASLIEDFLRKQAATRLVKMAAGWISTGYHLYMLEDFGQAPEWSEDAWIKIARHPVKKVVALALWIENEYATDQMVKEGWWG